MRKHLDGIKQRYAAARQQHVDTIKRVGRHPAFTIPLVTIGSLGILFVAVFAILSGGAPKLTRTDSHIVIISHDNTQQVVPTRADTVGAVLAKFHVAVHDGDVVEPATDTQIVTDNFRINVYRAVPVTIVDGARKQFAYSAATTPRSIVKQAGINVFPEDDLELLPTTNFLVEGSIGQRVVINRATPVNVNLYGTPVVMRTHAKTVGDLLAERGLLVQENDVVQPSASAPVANNMQVFVLHKGQKVVSEESTIDMPMQVIEDNSLTFGTTAVRQQGSPGKKLTTYLVETAADGTQTRKEIQQVITVQPVTQIIARGKAVQIPSDKQAVMAAAGISSSDYPYVDFIASHEGGWCPTKIQGTHNCPPYINPSDIPSYGGYGIFQATPGGKMASAGADWATSAITQIKWATGYANSRYGGWAGAYNHWAAYSNW
ncbi:MAG TPA: ubiquitin-like domain-containing protein [Candidatus Saccharimonadales bacterium]|nr:ubiquitin-like domain-containing protein [Candidatus Saccharimonadales bacterium]